MGSVKLTLATALMIPAFLVLTILVHEAGHGITAKVVGGVDISLYIWPGYELYPDFGLRYSSTWPGKSPGICNRLSSG